MSDLEFFVKSYFQVQIQKGPYSILGKGTLSYSVTNGHKAGVNYHEYEGSAHFFIIKTMVL